MNYIDLNENDNFLRYPTNKVVAIVNTPEQLQSAIREVNQTGFGEDKIDVLCGQKGAVVLMSPATGTASLLVCTDLLKNLETWNLRICVITKKNCVAATSFWRLRCLMKREELM